MKNLVFLVLAIFALPAFAGFQGFNGDTDLKNFSAIKCSTGLSCSKLKDKFVITSSPTLASALTLTGAEATDAIINMQADESDDSGDDWAIKSVASTNSLIFQNDVSGSLATKFTLSTAGNLSLVGDLSGDGGDQLVGFLNNQVAATATTLTAAQCGSTIINASGAVEVELPEASTVLGCRYTFIVGSANALTIDPDAADQILLLTNAAGDSLAADAAGESVTLEAISASQWAPVGAEKGTWTDSN